MCYYAIEMNDLATAEEKAARLLHVSDFFFQMTKVDEKWVAESKGVYKGTRIVKAKQIDSVEALEAKFAAHVQGFKRSGLRSYVFFIFAPWASIELAPSKLVHSLTTSFSGQARRFPIPMYWIDTTWNTPDYTLKRQADDSTLTGRTILNHRFEWHAGSGKTGAPLARRREQVKAILEIMPFPEASWSQGKEMEDLLYVAKRLGIPAPAGVNNAAFSMHQRRLYLLSALTYEHLIANDNEWIVRKHKDVCLSPEKNKMTPEEVETCIVDEWLLQRVMQQLDVPSAAQVVQDMETNLREIGKQEEEESAPTDAKTPEAVLTSRDRKELMGEAQVASAGIEQLLRKEKLTPKFVTTLVETTKRVGEDMRKHIMQMFTNHMESTRALAAVAKAEPSAPVAAAAGVDEEPEEEVEIGGVFSSIRNSSFYKWIRRMLAKGMSGAGNLIYGVFKYLLDFIMKHPIMKFLQIQLVLLFGRYMCDAVKSTLKLLVATQDDPAKLVANLRWIADPEAYKAAAPFLQPDLLSTQFLTLVNAMSLRQVVDRYMPTIWAAASAGLEMLGSLVQTIAGWIQAALGPAGKVSGWVQTLTTTFQSVIDFLTSAMKYSFGQTMLQTGLMEIARSEVIHQSLRQARRHPINTAKMAGKIITFYQLFNMLPCVYDTIRYLELQLRSG